MVPASHLESYPVKPLVIMPIMDTLRAVTSAASLDPRLAELVVVDNNNIGNIGVWSRHFTTGRNAGVGGSWNLGRQLVLDSDTEWLVICSEAILWNDGGVGFFHHLDRLADTDIQVLATRHNWHLIALRRELLDTVGEFDSVFYPAYYEDNDYGRRAALAGWPNSTWAVDTDCAVVSRGTRHTYNSGLVDVTFAAQRAKYARKWGASPYDRDPRPTPAEAIGSLDGPEPWTHPYNNPELPLTFTGEPPS